ncbi:hypothetical protein DL93DRAFT_2082319 [Clavulina sp. PMI_390]|nr:hypothetical protein DL93DRAFT_2082319 [Clavulina sp. PMI_390]
MGPSPAIRKLLRAIEEYCEGIADAETSLDPPVPDDACEQLAHISPGAHEILQNRLIRVQCRRVWALNSLAPAVALPNELLAMIFSYACCARPSMASPRWWNESGITRNLVNHTRMSIALTCVHWREVLLSTPNAWQDAVFAHPDTPKDDPSRLKLLLAAHTRMMLLQLERSKRLPRHIFIDSNEDHTGRQELTSLLALIVQSIADKQLHIEELCIRTSNPSSLFTSWLCTVPPPLLPNLRLLRIEWKEAQGPVLLDLRGATRLETLDIRSSWWSMSLSLLLSSPLSDIRLHHTMPMMDAFSAIIQNRATLERVEWKNNNILQTDQLFLAAEERVSFPRLLTLRLETPEVRVPLGKMELPALTALSLGSITHGADKHHLPSLRLLEVSHEDAPYLLQSLSDNSSIECISIDCLSESVINFLIQFLSTHDPGSPSSVAQDPSDVLPKLEIIHARSSASLIGIEGLAAASRSRHHPFVLSLDDCIPNDFSEPEKKSLDRILQEYPLILQIGLLPAKYDLW